MADETVGSVNVDITGDFSDLSDALDQAATAASAGAEAISGALNVPDAGQELAGQVETLGLSFDDLVAKSQGLQDAFQESLSTFNDVQSAFNEGDVSAGTLQLALEQLQSAASAAGESLKEAGDEAEKGGEQAESGAHQFMELAEAAAELGGITLGAEGLKEFAIEAISAYATVESVTVGLTQLTKSASEANEIIEEVKNLAATEPFAFPEIAPTIQRMVALGVSAKQIPGVMQAVANASAATGVQFSAVAQSFDRMALSGTVSSRSLVQLGISTADVGKAMGVAEDQVKTAFAALDQSERIDVLTAALEKFAGAAVAQADTVAGRWQILKNQWEEVMVTMGEASAPVVKALETLGSAAVALQAKFQLVQQVFTALFPIFSAIGLAAQALGIGADGAGKKLQTLGDNAGKAHGSLLDLGITLNTASDGLYALEQAQANANTALTKAAAVLAEAKTAYDAGNIGPAEYARAVNAYTSALAAANPKVKESTQDFSDLYVQLAKFEAIYGYIDRVGSSANYLEAAISPVGLEVQQLSTWSAKAGENFATLGQAMLRVAAAGQNVQMVSAQIGSTLNTTQGIMEAAGMRAVQSLQAEYDELLKVAAAMEATKASEAGWTSQDEQNMAAMYHRLADLQKSINDYGSAVDGVNVKTENWTKDFLSALNSISSSFAKLIVTGGNFGSTMISIVEQIAEKIISVLVEAAFGSLITSLDTSIKDTRTLGSLMSALGLSSTSSVAAALPGGVPALSSVAGPATVGAQAAAASTAATQTLTSATSAATDATTAATTATTELGSEIDDLSSTLGVATGATNVAASATSAAASATDAATKASGSVTSALSSTVSSITGLVGAIGSVGSFITGIIGDVETARSNTLLYRIEVDCREAATVLMQLEPYFAQFLPFLANLGPNAIAGGSTSGYGPDHTDLVNIANILTTMLAAMHVSTVAGGVTSGGLYNENAVAGSAPSGTVNVTLNVTSNDPTQIARQLATMLRSRGVIFTPS
jgi:hypothetical protein